MYWGACWEIEKENLRQQQAEGGEALEAAGKDDGARGEAG